MNAIAFNDSGLMRELTAEEINFVAAGVDWGHFWTGTATLALTVGAIATAPATAGTSLLLLGAVAGGASAGISLGLAFS